MITIISDRGTVEIDATPPLWVSAEEAERATGWTLKPEGMCQRQLCVPLEPRLVRNATVDLAAFWRKLGGPVVHDARGKVWVLGAPAYERNAALAGMIAPDFTLPDLDDVPRTLSTLRGRKVFLATWASW